ncbi:hypothetical protein B566_EDAN017334 [Ephemera danica]|nr:hypothetical protein B566_EDAN017334 [Ephemera danica]
MTVAVEVDDGYRCLMVEIGLDPPPSLLFSTGTKILCGVGCESEGPSLLCLPPPCLHQCPLYLSETPRLYKLVVPLFLLSVPFPCFLLHPLRFSPASSTVNQFGTNLSAKLGSGLWHERRLQPLSLEPVPGSGQVNRTSALLVFRGRVGGGDGGVVGGSKTDILQYSGPGNGSARTDALLLLLRSVWALVRIASVTTTPAMKARSVCGKSLRAILGVFSSLFDHVTPEQLDRFNTLYVGKLEARMLSVATLLANIDANIKNLQVSPKAPNLNGQLVRDDFS